MLYVGMDGIGMGSDGYHRSGILRAPSVLINYSLFNILPGGRVRRHLVWRPL